MAVSCSHASLLLLPLLVVLSISPQPTARAVTTDSLVEACNKTVYPKVCLHALATKPESLTASPRLLAELSVYVAAEVGTAVATFAHSELASIQDPGLWQCLDGCADDIEEAVAHLSSLTQELTDIKFTEVREWLSATLDGASTCEDSCRDAPISEIKNAIVTKSIEFEKLLRVTQELISAASISPASREFAEPPTTSWGASAPSPSWVTGAQAPSPSDEASAPESWEADAPEPSSDEADAPESSADESDEPETSSDEADAPTSLEAEAPTPSSGARAPSSWAADAPGPSSGARAPTSWAANSPAPSSGASSPTSWAADAPAPGPSSWAGAPAP